MTRGDLPRAAATSNRTLFQPPTVVGRWSVQGPTIHGTQERRRRKEQESRSLLAVRKGLAALGKADEVTDPQSLGSDLPWRRKRKSVKD